MAAYPSFYYFLAAWPYWVPITIGGPLCYTALFVVLEDFREPIATILESFMRIPRRDHRHIKKHLHIFVGATILALDIFTIVYYIKNVLPISL